MPEINNSDTVRSQYLGQDRGVSLDKLVREREQIEQGGLDKVEFRDRPKTMDRDDFLKLLVKQLTTQDPTAPVQDQQFISQMAQFSSLEQMKNMADGFQSMSNRQAIGLVGKFVIGKDYTSGESASGVAQALIFDSAGQAFLKVGSRAILVKDIEMVADPASVRSEFGGQAAPPALNAAPSTAGTPAGPSLPGQPASPAAPAQAPAHSVSPETAKPASQSPSSHSREDAGAKREPDVQPEVQPEKPASTAPQSFYYGEPPASVVQSKTEFAA